MDITAAITRDLNRCLLNEQYRASLKRYLTYSLMSVALMLGSLLPMKSNAEDGTIHLFGTWHLVRFQSMDDSIGTLRPSWPNKYTMTLSADRSVTMNLNCNRAMGQWTAEPSSPTGGDFRFGVLATTRALCAEPSLDQKIATDTQFVRSYTLHEGELHLSLMADAGIYSWTRIDDSELAATTPLDKPSYNSLALSPEAGGPRNWRVAAKGGLNLRAEASTIGAIIKTYSVHTLLDNLGCKKTPSRTWCDVQEFGGGPRGFVAAEFLMPAVSPDGSIARGEDDSALRAGAGDFDARGKIPCAQYRGQTTGDCDFGVARAGGGYATVVVTRFDGSSRALFFRMGIATGADTSQADGYPDFTTNKQADLYLIRVGDERYQVPEAVIFGG